MMFHRRSGVERETLFRKDFVLNCLASLGCASNATMSMTAMPLFVKSLGGQDATVGLVVGFFLLAAVVGRVIAGRALDLFNRKMILTAGSAIVFLASLGYPFVHDIPLLLILRLVHGAGFALISSSNVTLAVEFAPPRRRGEALGYYGLSGTTATALAPSTALFLIDRSMLGLEGFSLLFIAGAAVAACALVFAILLGEPVRPRRTAAPRQLRPRDFFARSALPIGLTALLAMIPYGALFAFLPLLTREHAGIFFVTFALFSFVSRPLVGVASDRFGRRTAVIPGMAVAGFAIAILAIAPSLPVVVLSGALYGLGFGGLIPALIALTAEVVPAAKRGVALGNYVAGADLGAALGSMTLGLVAQAVGYGPMFLVAASSNFAALAYFVALPRLQRRDATALNLPAAPRVSE